MKIRSKISSFGGGRMMIEVPKSVRDNFSLREEVLITKAVKKPSKKRVELMNIG
jgi:hypothetical protein